MIYKSGLGCSKQHSTILALSYLGVKANLALNLTEGFNAKIN
jgi:hypothetical protein